MSDCATAGCCSCERIRARRKGTCTRGIYDNMKTAVETIFVGRERAYNRRFLQMCSHYTRQPSSRQGRLARCMCLSGEAGAS